MLVRFRPGVKNCKHFFENQCKRLHKKLIFISLVYIMNLFEELQRRGLIKDSAWEDLEKVINSCDATFYRGTDPTAESLHIGHYSSLITVKRLAKAGHHPILLVGGATWLIWDPRPTAEREIIAYETVQRNFEWLKKQVTELFDWNVEVVNNYDWTKDITILEFLREIWKYINVNYMLNKDIISRRLETGITFAEFTYTLLQWYDFLHLYETKNCIMQAAWSDQWWNITTWIELINKKLWKNAYAFTMPLILDNAGNKFWKTTGNALWLDKNKTSSYEIYQYLVNSDDSKVEEYLKVFTFLSPEEIMDVIAQHQQAPEQRIAQKTLAKEFITDLHWQTEYEKVQKIIDVLFWDTDKLAIISNMSEDEKSALARETWSVKLQWDEVRLLDLIVESGLASSNWETKKLIQAGSIYFNEEKVEDIQKIVKSDDLVNWVGLLRKWKKTYKLILG